jgi:hypothetical protein
VTLARPTIDLRKEKVMTTNENDLDVLGRRLVGEWTTEATHPAVPGTVVHGTASVEWLEGEQFLIFRSRSDHPNFPDSISVIGDTDGLRMHYFDSRGIHRIYGMTVTNDGWEIARDAPEFSQRLWVTFADEDTTMIGKSKLSEDHETWNDDLEINYHRAR